MTDIYTRHVRDPRNVEIAREMLGHFRSEIARRISARGIQRPRWVGVVGHEWTEGAREELAYALYLSVIQEQRAALELCVSLGRSIDGLVMLSLCQHLTRRQRDADPIGYKTFKNCQALMVAAVKDGLLHTDATPPFQGTATFWQAADGGLLTREELRVLLARSPDWHGALAAQTRQGTRSTEILRPLVGWVVEHRGAGFRLKDFVAVLKGAARNLADSLHSDVDGEVAAALGEEWERRIRIAELAPQMEAELRVTPATTRTNRLQRIWAAILGHDVPTSGGLATLTGVAPSTISEDLAILAALVQKIEANGRRQAPANPGTRLSP